MTETTSSDLHCGLFEYFCICKNESCFHVIAFLSVKNNDESNAVNE